MVFLQKRQIFFGIPIGTWKEGRWRREDEYCGSHMIWVSLA